MVAVKRINYRKPPGDFLNGYLDIELDNGHTESVVLNRGMDINQAINALRGLAANMESQVRVFTAITPNETFSAIIRRLDEYGAYIGHIFQPVVVPDEMVQSFFGRMRGLYCSGILFVKSPDESKYAIVGLNADRNSLSVVCTTASDFSILRPNENIYNFENYHGLSQLMVFPLQTPNAEQSAADFIISWFRQE